MTDGNHAPGEKFININESIDLNFWCDELNLKKDELMTIVEEVGPVVHDVRLFIAKRLLINWPSAY
jgi:hypothetical protein